RRVATSRFRTLRRPIGRGVRARGRKPSSVLVARSLSMLKPDGDPDGPAPRLDRAGGGARDHPAGTDDRLQPSALTARALALPGAGGSNRPPRRHGALPADRARRRLGGPPAGRLHGRLHARLRTARRRLLERPPLRAFQPLGTGPMDVLLERPAARL